MTRLLPPLLAGACVLAACTDNDFGGNDRAAAFAGRHAPAEVVPARRVLRQAMIRSVMPETMSEREMSKILDPDAACRFTFTAAGAPVVAAAPRTGGAAARGAIKLNGQLVALRAAENRNLTEGVLLSADGIGAVVTPVEPDGERRREAGFRLVLDGRVERGYRGYYRCPPVLMDKSVP